MLKPAWLPGTELYSWHGFDLPVPLSSKFELIVHSRLRSRNELNQVQQVRSGGIFRYSAGKLTPFFGYYFQPAHESHSPWTKGHRFFTGVERALALPGNFSFTARLAAERHISTGLPAYMRYRSYAKLQFPGKRVAPYLQNEMLAVRQGYHSMRNGGGLSFRFNSGIVFEAGYLYDIRRTFWGGDRSAIVTSLKFPPPSMLFRRRH
jgi:hypothetical protein